MEIKVKFTNSEYCDSTDTEVILTLPALDENNYNRFKEYCKEYTLFNTHISYKFYFDQELLIDLPALNSIIELPTACTTCGYRYDRNPNSVYCYSETDLNDFLNDIFDKNISVYNAINRSGFREIHQHDGRFDDWKTVRLEQLTFSKAKKLHNALRKSMLPMFHMIPRERVVEQGKQHYLLDMNKLNQDILKLIVIGQYTPKQRTQFIKTIISNFLLFLKY